VSNLEDFGRWGRIMPLQALREDRQIVLAGQQLRKRARYNDMDKITVVARTQKNNDIDIKAYRDKDVAIAQVMEDMYGEDWEMQMNDEEWELSDDIKFAFDNLMEYGWYSFDGTSDQIIVIKEVEIY
jgi:hypothetical protein